MKELAKQYDPKQVEDRIYADWLAQDVFRAEHREGKTPYTIVIPPPNVTAQLHMGHALDNTLQDILIRFKRMQGFDTLWLPGTDHAAIATEVKIVAAMKEEGLTKADLGYEKFMERAWVWKEKYGGAIINQLKKLGSSCDWSRERFTMDEGCSRAVREVFVNLYKKGLIYRGNRLVNWCPGCVTALSDAEVEHEDHDGNFWHIRYPLTDGTGYIEVATTRPETMLGDTAVAVHPEDERYTHLVGKTLILPLVGKEIPIIADAYVEKDFGTGAVKITPAHDPNDYEVGQRHNLPIVDVMTDTAAMTGNAGKYAGMDRYACRKAIVADLEAQGFLVKTEKTRHSVGHCQRCKTVVEPRISLQWFVKMAPLAAPAIEAVTDGSIKFVPGRFDKQYLHWMENLRDWCISRQIWWGHRIPVWYCPDCGAQICEKTDPAACPQCGSNRLTQDDDTLDTWFSSALWPFSTLGWPDNTDDLSYFYPTNTLVTGYDIITFWVSRMIFSGLEHMNEKPFDTVLIHGLVRDGLGRKMSKSLGNGVDPLDVINQYGADALRFALVTGNSPGNDMRWTEEKAQAARNFANKIWNAARFILMNLGSAEAAAPLPGALPAEDAWILSRLNTTIREVTDNLEKFELGLAAGKVQDFLWGEFCDWYIELAKPRLQGADAAAVQSVLVYCMRETMKLLHPFMPFITEEIYQSLPGADGTIVRADWPRFNPAFDNPAMERQMLLLMDLIKGVRSVRAERNVPPSRKARLLLQTDAPEVFHAGAPYLERLAAAAALEFLPTDSPPPAASVTVVTNAAKAFIPLGDLVDMQAQQARLQKELAQAEKFLAAVQAKLSNDSFISKAPPKVVEQQKEQERKLEAQIANLREAVSQ
ncbi:MAG: valine--tRNA ligase [Oscillospiraceae bacterium]|jgi:valyl-tRNA synthetase|nr:valine--tRNA ligase [Oscillospiraceae bacterium]